MTVSFMVGIVVLVYRNILERINAMDKVKCACNGKSCGGTCRETHLFRKRKYLPHCPAAFGDKGFLEGTRQMQTEDE